MYLLYTTNGFSFSDACSVRDPQRTSQRSRNISDQLDFVSLAIALFLPRCDVIRACITEQITAKWKPLYTYIYLYIFTA